jgi:PAS domain-containing protein
VASCARGQHRVHQQALLDYFGAPLGEIIGWGWAERVHPEDVAFKVKSWLSNLETLTMWSADFAVRTADIAGSTYVEHH